MIALLKVENLLNLDEGAMKGSIKATKRLIKVL